ncbi:Ornithine carbamoyltransferase subunit I [Buchnera aphidicola (Thelaxes suberi)]|uniref:ornithine carbamoyltransferase n=1 Tax=Buchnera aphidicola TaxID=9 RepID=UPI003464D224
MQSLYKRHCLTISNFTISEIEKIIKFSQYLKNHKALKKEKKYLKNNNIAFIFEKASTRTKCAATVACFDQGASITYIDPDRTHFKYKESIKDTTLFLSKIYDGILYRGGTQKDLNIIAKNSSVPVWNALTDESHPTQIFADILTMQEHSNNTPWNQIRCVYIGDINNNICTSLIEASNIIGFNLILIAPKKLWKKYNTNKNNQQILEKCINRKITYTDNIEIGIKNADFIYTDVWVSINEPEKLWDKRINLLKNYQVNKKLLDMSNNNSVKIMHCLPAFHDNKTYIGNKIMQQHNLNNGIEITDDVFFSKHSIIFEQAENKLHTLKALITSSLKKIKFIKNNLFILE